MPDESEVAACLSSRSREKLSFEEAAAASSSAGAGATSSAAALALELEHSEHSERSEGHLLLPAPPGLLESRGDVVDDVQRPSEGREGGLLPTLDVEDGGILKLDHLGPVIVGTDGTLSRIANWNELSEREQAVALRRIAKRNRERLAALQATKN
ncbi:hypothetical protein NFJ02_18g31330 [Pycnococcus provasolii]